MIFFCYSDACIRNYKLFDNGVDFISCWTKKRLFWFLTFDTILLVSIIQLQLPAEVESVLLQQVLNLTPEQLSSLPPEQQQQVIQLQQVLRRDQIQPS